MYYYISKLAYLFIAPENWIIALVLAALLIKNAVTRKRLQFSVLALILLFGNRFLFTTLVTAWQPKPVDPATMPTCEAAILLGGGASFDKYGVGYFNSAADRFIQAVILYKTGKVKRIIISGGSNAAGQPKDADFQYRKMLDLGIPATDLIVEDSSATTFENAVCTKQIIDPLHLQPPFILVTSATHIPRAQSVFVKAGIPVIPFPCNYNVVESQLSFSDYFIPNTATLFSWSGFLKEVVGMLGYRLFHKA
jgi:uncharacterized SAM-binding protein YcdF (DUF218 family)